MYVFDRVHGKMHRFSQMGIVVIRLQLSNKKNAQMYEGIYNVALITMLPLHYSNDIQMKGSVQYCVKST